MRTLKNTFGRTTERGDRTQMLRLLRVIVLFSALLAFLTAPAAAGPAGPNACGGDHDIPQVGQDNPVYSSETLDPGSADGAGDWTILLVEVCMWLQGV